MMVSRIDLMLVAGDNNIVCNAPLWLVKAVNAMLGNYATGSLGFTSHQSPATTIKGKGKL